MVTGDTIELAPLERLRIRESLQDQWRDQVRRITLLSLGMRDDPDAEEPAPIDTVDGVPGKIEEALAEARRELVHLEVAMARLDCGSCGG